MNAASTPLQGLSDVDLSMLMRSLWLESFWVGSRGSQ
jgi:hypothetical protein